MWLILLFSVAWGTEVPMSPERWVGLAFNRIPKNRLEFAAGEIRVTVDKSAGPLVHKLEAPVRVNGFKVKGELKGLKKKEAGEFDEDSVLRIGLVAVGDKRLNAVKRVFAADWVKKLFALAPAGTGLDKIYFFNLTDRAELVGRTRPHPKSELLVERVFKAVAAEGPFEAEYQLETPIETAALWLSVDGDDTGSQFELKLRQISIH